MDMDMDMGMGMDKDMDMDMKMELNGVRRSAPHSTIRATAYVRQ